MKQVVVAATTEHVAAIARVADEVGEWGVYRMSPDGGRVRAAPLPADAGDVVSIALSPDGSRLAVCTRSASVAAALSDMAPQGPVLVFTMEPTPGLRHSALIPGHGRIATVTPDGRDLVLASSSGQIGIIRFAEGLVMAGFTGRGLDPRSHAGAIQALALSPDAQLLFSIAQHPVGLELKVWGYANHRGEVRPDLTAPGRPLTLDVSPDGAALAIGTEGGGVHVRVVPPP